MQTLHDIFLLPWRDATLMYWPIIVQGILVSCGLGLLGCFLVVRGLSLLGDALSHAVLPGIAIGFFVSAALGSGSLHSPWILIGATAMGVAAALLVETVHRQSRVKEDASLGIVFTTLFALGVILISRYATGVDLDANCVLYGNIENYILEPDAIWPMALILALIVLGIVVFYRPLIVSTFDPAMAVSAGVAVWLVHYGFMTMLSLTIVASFEAVGAILAVAFLILPGATARLWTHKLSHMLWFSAAFGIVTAVVGYWLSHPAVLNTSAGAAMVVAGFGVFILSWLAAPRTGLVSRWRVRRRLRRVIELENLVKTISELAGDDPAAPVPIERLSAELKWNAAGVREVASRGGRRGWIAADADALRLTPAGAARSRRLAAAHIAWEAYLQDRLGLPADHVHDAAEWIEHYLHEEELPALASR